MENIHEQIKQNDLINKYNKYININIVSELRLSCVLIPIQIQTLKTTGIIETK